MATCIIAAETQTFNSHFQGDTATLRIYASEQAYSAEGVQITGSPVCGSTWYKEYECTVANGVVTIPEVELPTTTDAFPPNLTYTAILYDETGARQNTKLSGFALDWELLVANSDTVIESTVTITAAGTSAANGNYTYRGQNELRGYWNLEGQSASTSNYAIVWTEGTHTAEVTMAGTVLMQGTYVQTGTQNGRDLYEYNGNTIEWSGTQWEINNGFPQTQYYSTDDVEFPWEVTTWVADFGAAPLPVVTNATPDGRWSITNASGDTYYYSEEDVEYPWDVETWIPSLGVAPLPAVTQAVSIVSTTWNAVFLTNNLPCVPCPPDIDLLYIWIANYIANNNIPWASTTVGGKIYTSKIPLLSYHPIAVESSEPVWICLDRARSLDEWDGDLEAAITDIADDEVTLLISDSYTADAALIDSGSLTIGQAYQIVTYPGEVTYFENVNGGTGYSTGTNIPCTGGSGSGMTVDITFVSGGVITGLAINNGGTGYEVGDVVTPTGGGANAKILINTVEGDDFSNCGCVWTGYPTGFANQAGTVFIATSQDPADWTNQSELRPCVTVPDNITIQFWGEGTLRAENGGGIYISKMLNPGQKQVFTSDGSGKIFVAPNAVDELNLAWWTGEGTGTDDTHEFKQAKESLQIDLKGGSLYIPQGDWYTTEIKWTSFSAIRGAGSALDGIFGTNIYPADLNAQYQGVFSAMQLFQGITFKDFFLSQDTSTSCSSFRFVAVRSTSQNMVFDSIRFESVAAAGAEYNVIFRGETSFEEFVNINFYNCSWTCWDETGNLFWESTNSVATFVNPQFRTRVDSNSVYLYYGGYMTFIQPEFRGVADYVSTLELDRTITAACDTTATDNTVLLNTDETDGNYLTREDLGRMISVPGVTWDGESDTYITGINTPWSFEVAAAPDQTVNNQNISLYDVSDMPIANTCIRADTHICINVFGSSDEGFNYFLRDNATDHYNTFNLYGSLLQSKVLFEGGSSTFNSYGNIYYSGTFNADDSGPVVRFMGDTIQTFIIPRYEQQYPFPNVRALLTGEAWHLCPNNLYTITDYSTKQGDDRSDLYNIINQPSKFVQHAQLGGPAYTDPWMQILTTDFAGGNDQRLLRLGTAWKTSDIARYYYDFYRNSTNGNLEIYGNQTGNVGIHLNGSLELDGNIVVDSNATVEGNILGSGYIYCDTLGENTGIGYTTGTSGSVTQQTNRDTAVTLNTFCGTIATDNTVQAANDVHTFTVNNSYVKTGDVIIANTGTFDTSVPRCSVVIHNVIDNAFQITTTNISGANDGTTTLIKFALFRGLPS